MAYCVHCGVRLEQGIKTCPLCGTRNIDPNELKAAERRAYPERMLQQDLRRSRRFILELLAILLLLPAFLCVALDLLLTPSLTWSVYAAGALLMLYISVCVPICRQKHRTVTALAVSYTSLVCYLLVVEWFSASGPWMMTVVWPALTFALIMALTACSGWMRRHLNKMTWPGAILTALGLECVVIEGLHSLNHLGRLFFFWSPCAFAPCVFIALLLFYINHNRALREEVRRRVHF